MTDRELLELAARAVGMPKGWFDEDLRSTYEWNPLTDDGDALRLAVKLGMSIEVLSDQGFTVVHSDLTTSQSEQHKNDPYAATRRAIVRAAAEIGKTTGETK